MDESALTFRSEPRQAPEIEIRVNFGMFAGRDATHAEIDDLARDLLGAVHRVSIVSLRRHELDEGGEAAIHQVKVEASPADAVDSGDDLAERLLDLVDAWARRSIEQRHAEVSELDALPEPTG
jgi:hypothetical protein